METLIKVSKNKIKYISKKDFDALLNNNKFEYQNINNINLWDYVVINDIYYCLYNKGNYYTIYSVQTFINLTQFNDLEKEYNNTLNDLKENKDCYGKEEIYQLKGKLHYIAELINRGRNQLTNLKILK